MNNEIKSFEKVKDFENKIRKYHSLPEAVVIDCKLIGYPFHILNIDLTYLANRQLQLVEEFVMKCINYDLNIQAEIAAFLGMDESLIEKVLSELLSKGLIQRENTLKLTELGSVSLEKQTVLAPLSETKIFYIDALSGKLSDKFSLNLYEKNNNDNFLLNKIIKRPRKNNIEDVVDYYEHIEKSLQNYNNSNQIELIQVNNIEKVYTEYHELSLVLYQRNPDDQEIEYEIFSRGNIQVDYRTTIEQLYAEGKKILDPIFQEIKDDKLIDFNDENNLSASINYEDVKAVEKLTLKINSFNDPDLLIETKDKVIKEERQKLKHELEQIQTKSKISEIIHTYEHRDYLFKALKEAKNRVMIVSPWIKGFAVDKNFLEQLEETLKRNIQVYIYYGIKGSNQQNDRRSIENLEELSERHKYFQFKKAKNTHRKILVCDSRFGIVTSFNFLSFRADPNLTYRDELGVIIRDKSTIEDLFQSGKSLCDS
ncbi:MULTISPECIES: phospholipase D-like domain-containing protein [Pseudanabaena]|uniref:phospholipase D-like domain-containing protein n=1 Tax=Pseudanabaena TaxID=1152 RepID=UPI002479C24A|nr:MULTISPECIES: phospholipase D-like domain-containing protein [Pseudanabaena]MEA5487637.1 phospholipase D-like domain-containing protein [Pseudanabaena sp. CCNP1317]WGS75424.1 phospholipase D-like domain-containing protein [Pseudanabaena galeata CCNP1313]